ncbi:MAG: 23S rRNA (adenine(2503)-C(2))-methyltransferase RlmN [Thermodesulfobacteriota bacterium]|nr:23S rRNA (adenine(2503)-C(2))-methyltransferase RlmN [Thermodesulfobacteriota bacterium]
MQDIKNYTRKQFQTWLAAHDIAPYRAGQVYKWIYLHQADTFDEMTNIAKPVRALLGETFSIGRMCIAKREYSADGTCKYLFQLDDNHRIESVWIPEEGHATLCISTQVGCAQGCAFCRTADMGFIRNLTPAEIIGQIRDIRQDTASSPLRLSNLVFMGMGEPLANYDNVLSAIDTITDGDCGLQFSTRRVTLSTAGLVPRIKTLGHETTINLAVSLNATDNATRDRLMPVNKTYPIETLLAACRGYPLSNRRKITFEYILIRGQNDTLQDAEQLARLLAPIKAKINLIPFNGHDQSPFQRPDDTVIEQFKQILHDRNYTVITRLSKGQDISAACGQLAVSSGVS